MKLKKVLLPVIAGAFALSLAACGGEDKAKPDATSQEQKAPQEEKEVPKEEKEAANEMQAELEKQQVEQNEVVAIVNDEELKGEEYNAVLKSIQGQMVQMGQDPSSKESAEQVKKQALDMLVNQTLILQKAKEAEIKAEKSEIDEKYTAFAEQFGDEKEMKKALKNEDMDEKTLKADLAELIIIEKYQDKVAPVEEVTEEEIKAYYDQVAAQSKESGQELPALEEVSEEIKSGIEQEQQQKQLAEHVEALKVDAEIELKI